jgi:hypothetical protein
MLQLASCSPTTPILVPGRKSIVPATLTSNLLADFEEGKERAGSPAHPYLPIPGRSLWCISFRDDFCPDMPECLY